VLLTCHDDNLASARTIEKHRGVLEDVRDVESGRMRRYWIDLSARGSGTG
jgi:predicted acetyltransferase